MPKISKQTQIRVQVVDKIDNMRDEWQAKIDSVEEEQLNLIVGFNAIHTYFETTTLNQYLSILLYATLRAVRSAMCFNGMIFQPNNSSVFFSNFGET